MTKKVAIINMSERRDADISVTIAEPGSEPEVVVLKPTDVITLDRDDLAHVSIADVPGRGTERFVGQRNKRHLSPHFSVHFRDASMNVDVPIEPAADEEDEEAE